MGLFDKKDSSKSREARIYSEFNDANTITITLAKVDDDADCLAYVLATQPNPQWFRCGDGEYRLSSIKRVKLGKIIDENDNKSS